MKIRKVILSCLLYSFSQFESSQVAAWDYAQHGKNWNTIQGSQCGSASNQAPINLDSSQPQNSPYDDGYQKHYGNMNDAKLKIDSSYKALVLELPDYSHKKYCRNYFVSKIGKDTGNNMRYNAQDVVFRSKSEHTIDGKQFDLEMQIHHTGDSNTNDVSVLSVLFDTADHADDNHVSEDQVKIIDAFFGSLDMSDKTNSWSVEEEVPLGQLMSTLDTMNRWVYTAKSSMPPCKANGYYNVLSIVYPIKAEHLELIRGHIAQVPGTPQNGNFRAIQATNNQKPRLLYVDRTPPPDPVIENDFQVTLTELYTTILIIWCVIALIALLVLLYKIVKKKMDNQKQQGQEFKGYQDGQDQVNADTGRSMV